MRLLSCKRLKKNESGRNQMTGNREVDRDDKPSTTIMILLPNPRQMATQFDCLAFGKRI
jgi:hypothetical protein